MTGIIYYKIILQLGRYRWQADVETVHDIIEREFFEVETFTDRSDFMNKTFTYQLFFNLKGPNTYKENKSPWQLVQKKNTDIKKDVLMIPVVDLGLLLKTKLDNIFIKGYTMSLLKRPVIFPYVRTRRHSFLF
ncbi:MAG: hypothetical protein ABII25_00840 [bacterium]